MPSTSGSTLTAQSLIKYARLFPFCIPALQVAGYEDEPAISFLNDICQKIMAKTNPWKWNLNPVPVFQTQPYQQDYPTSISQNVMGWLPAAVMVDINSTSTPKATPPLTTVVSLLPTFQVGRPQKVCWIANNMAQTGTWPGPNTLYTNPLISVGGGPGTNPLTAITDPNGNIQVVTTYGVTGNGISGPTWPSANAAAGTTTNDGSVVWTVQDPNGVAFRIDALATFNSNVWEFHIAYQKKAPVITSLTQTIAPIPDSLGYLVKQGFLAYCYKASDNAKFAQEYEQWLGAIQESLGADDREMQEFGMYPAQPVQGGHSDGSAGGHGYSGWPGWQ